MDDACRMGAEEINRREFDVVLTTNCWITGIPSIARYLAKPCVIYIHEPWRTNYEALPVLPWVAASDERRSSIRARVRYEADAWNCRVFARLERGNAACYRTRLVNSLFNRESVLRAYGLDAKVCYQGVDTSTFRPDHGGRSDYLLGVGEYSYHKNIPFVIKCVAAMTAPRPPLVWIGNGGSKTTMFEMSCFAESKGVDFRPFFGVSDDELVQHYNRARLLVYAPRLEPFGLAPLEANACGLPVVAVEEGGVRETIVNGVNGFLVEQDAEVVADAIRRLLEDPALAEEMGSQGKAVVEKRWSLDQSVGRLEARLRDACGVAT